MTKQDTAAGAKVLGFTMGVLLIGVVVVLSVAWMALWGGLALSVLWGWFVAPYFNVPELSILHAYGVYLVGLALRGGNRGTNGMTNSEYISRVMINAPFACAMWLVIGWIVKGMM